MKRTSLIRFLASLFFALVSGFAYAQTVVSGTYTGQTIADSISVAASTTATFTGNTTFTGPNATLGNSSGIYWQQVGSLTGKTISQGSGSFLYISGANSSLTLGAGTTITGDVSVYSDGNLGTALTNQGTLTHSISSGQLYARTFTNTGTITANAGTLTVGSATVGYDTFNSGAITANGSGTTVYISGNVANTGTLAAQNSGILRFNGTNTQANLGNVTLATGGRALLDGLLNITGTLTAPTGGMFELFSGTVSGGTIASNALTFTSSGGTLNGVTLSGDLALPASSTVYFSSGTAFTGANVTLGNSSGIYWQQVGTLTGKTIAQGSGSYLYVTGTNNSLTLGAGTTITGDVSVYSDGSTGTAITNQGTLTHSISSGQLYARTFTNTGTITANAGTLTVGSTTAGYNSANSGTITADGSGSTVYISGNVTNTGTLAAQNSGILRFNGTNTQANLGNVTLATGGRALLDGLLNITGTLTAPTGGMFELYSGTVSGGTIAPSALSFTSSGGTLSGVTLSGDLALPASSHVYFSSGTAFTGANATLGNSSGIYWQQVGTLTGKTIAQGSGSYLYVTGTNNSLTLGAGTTITGDVSVYSDGSTGTAITNQGTLTHSISSGQLYARTFTNTGTITANAGTLTVGSTTAGYDSANSGTITADGSGSTVYISGNVTNTGTLAAQNSGILRFNGTNTQANLGNVTLASGGRALLDGLLNITGTLTAPTGGMFELYSGTVSGGTIAPSALSFTSSGGTLSGVTLSGDLALPASSHVYFSSGTTFTGANATLGNSSGIYWQQVGTLTGKTIAQGSGSYLYVTGTNNSLTLGAGTTITGDVSVYSDGSTGTAITNQGTLTHSISSGQLYARTFTNTGTITANAGTLTVGSATVGYNSANSGTITADGSGSTINLDGNFTNTGTLRAENSGQLRLRGTNTTSSLGNIVLNSGGRVLLDGILDNTSATLTAPTGGLFELFSGKITGGTVASNALSFTSSGGYLDNTILTGTVNVPANTYAYVTGNTALNAASLTFGANAYFYVTNDNSTLSLNAATSATGDIRLYTSGNTGTAITNLGTIAHTAANTGYLYGRTFTNQGNITASAGSLQVGSTSVGYNTSNSGNITVTGSGVILYLDGNVTNAGTLRAENTGQLRLRGTNTTANLGNIVLASGGRVQLDGILDNTGATLNVPTGGLFELFSGKITGGTVASNALSFTSSGGYLDNTILTGTVNVPANTYAYVTGNTALNAASLTFGANAYFYVTNDNSTLSLNAATSATGDIRLYTSGNTGTTITNLGTIAHTAANTGYLYGRTFTNQGNITASAGALQVGTNSAGYNTINSGNITVTGSGVILYLDGNVANTGTLRAENSGQLRLRGTNTTANLGNIVLASGGRVLLDGILDNTGATLTAPTGGLFELFSGKITGGTVGSNALSFTSSGGYLDNTILTGTVNVPASTYAYVTGNTALNAASLTFGANAYFYVTNDNSSLSLNAATSATGDIRLYTSGNTGTAITNLGTIAHTAANTGYLYGRTFTNQGNITASAGALQVGYNSAGYNTVNSGNITVTGSGVILYLDGNVANTGTLRAENSGQLRLRGTNTTANLGNIVLASGGRVLLDGILDNTGATLNAPTGGLFELFSGKITGGTVASNALSFTSSGGYLDNTILTGTVSVPANTQAYITGNTALNAASLTFGANAYFYVTNDNSTLSLNAATSATGDIRLYTSGNTGTAITNLGTIAHTAANTGYLYGRTFTNQGNITASAGALQVGTNSAGYNTVNSGNITASGAGVIVYFDGNFTNSGLVSANNSAQLHFRGNNTTGNLGNVTLASGGRALLDGTLTNTALAAPTGGAFELYSGTILGGTTAPGALTFTPQGGYLDGVTFGGNLTLPASAYVRFIHGTQFTGTNLSFGANAGLYWQQSGTLTGKTLSFGTNAYLYVTSTNNTLTLDATTTATGDITIYSDGSTGTNIANQGALTHTGGTGSLYARQFSNAGTITASAGTLYLGYPSAGYDFDNLPSGTITVAGASVFLRAPSGSFFNNAGVLNVQSGTLFTSNVLRNGPGSFLGGAGTISGGVNLAGGTLAPGNSVGTLTLASSTFAVTAPTVFAVEISGASADKLLFNSPTAPIDLGTGLLTLSVTLLSPPTSASYDLIRIGTGTGTITGTFANLPTNGASFNAYFGGLPYTFAVNYQPTFVALNLTAVPEPSTYALLGTGVVLIALLRRRRA